MAIRLCCKLVHLFLFEIVFQQISQEKLVSKQTTILPCKRTQYKKKFNL